MYYVELGRYVYFGCNERAAKPYGLRAVIDHQFRIKTDL